MIIFPVDHVTSFFPAKHQRDCRSPVRIVLSCMSSFRLHELALAPKTHNIASPCNVHEFSLYAWAGSLLAWLSCRMARQLGQHQTTGTGTSNLAFRGPILAGSRRCSSSANMFL